jgi:hypothetical protein
MKESAACPSGTVVATGKFGVPLSAPVAAVSHFSFTPISLYAF